MKAAAEWSLAARVAFRFGVIAGALLLFPWPLTAIPELAWLTDAVQTPWQLVVDAFGEHVLGVDMQLRENGSGDQMPHWVTALARLIVAAIGAAVWSIADRRGRAYPRLASAMLVWIRYGLAFELVTYGVIKILPGQFISLQPARLEQHVGELSPMGLLWTLMSYSRPYTVFAGMLELAAGLLLLWRRTSVLGAVLACTILTNIVVLDLAFDVAARLHAIHLLVLALVIVMPHARRLLAALLGHATTAVPDRLRMSARRERARRIAKVAMCGLLAFHIYVIHDEIANRPTIPSELEQVWIVETMTIDGVEPPPLLTESRRWRSVSIGNKGSVRFATGARVRLRMSVDAAKRTIDVTDLDAPDPTPSTWRYELRDAEHLTLDAIWNGAEIHASLVKAPPWLLETHGVDFIAPEPFHR